MNDSIYRQMAIDALGEKPLAWTEGEYELGLQNQWQSDVDALKDLPTAEHKGQWIKPTGMMPPEYAGVYRCSECGSFAMQDWKTHKQTLTDYCPSCGARMENE